ncbi:YfiR family protein, partial [Pseudomonas sp. N40(2020)]|uniref:YfiR family protein n=1 Tax=Pseudomonas sp. N40(2020) TaxID=2767798 RepID=UPI001656FECF
PTVLRHAAALACVALALLLGLQGAVRAQSVGSDAQAKARLVATFARFVQWPAAAFAGDDAPLLLCVAQDSPALADAFRRQLAAPPAGRPMQLVLTSTGAPARGGCHLLYIDDSAPRRLAVPLPPADEPVLTMALIDGFAGRGG